MKYKIIFNTISGNELIYNEYFNTWSKKGWKLAKFSELLILFERCEQPLKYQTLFDEPDESYQEEIRQKGYEYITSNNTFKNLYLYASSNLEAPDLYDQNTYKEKLLKYNQFGGLLGLCLLGFAFCAWSVSYMKGWHNIFLKWNDFTTTMITLLGAITFLSMPLICIWKRHCIKHNIYNSYLINYINIGLWILVVLIFILIILSKNMSQYIYLITVVSVIVGRTIYISLSYILKSVFKGKEKLVDNMIVISGLLFMFLILVSPLIFILNTHDDEKEYTYSDLNSYYTTTDIDNFFIEGSEFMYSKENQFYSDNYLLTARNNAIAKYTLHELLPQNANKIEMDGYNEAYEDQDKYYLRDGKKVVILPKGAIGDLEQLLKKI